MTILFRYGNGKHIVIECMILLEIKDLIMNRSVNLVKMARLIVLVVISACASSQQPDLLQQPQNSSVHMRLPDSFLPLGADGSQIPTDHDDNGGGHSGACGGWDDNQPSEQRHYRNGPAYVSGTWSGF